MESGSSIETYAGLTVAKQLRAAQFIARHVSLPSDLQDGYKNRTVDLYLSGAGADGEHLWLREDFNATASDGIIVSCTPSYSLDMSVSGWLEFKEAESRKTVSIFLEPKAEMSEPLHAASFLWDMQGVSRALDHFDKILQHRKSPY